MSSHVSNLKCLQFPIDRNPCEWNPNKQYVVNDVTAVIAYENLMGSKLRENTRNSKWEI